MLQDPFGSHFGVTLEPSRNHLGVILEPFKGHSGGILGPPWSSLWDLFGWCSFLISLLCVLLCTLALAPVALMAHLAAPTELLALAWLMLLPPQTARRARAARKQGHQSLENSPNLNRPASARSAQARASGREKEKREGEREERRREEERRGEERR